MSFENDKKKYLAYAVQDFLRDWKYLSTIVQICSYETLYEQIQEMFLTPEINWKFNQIFLPIFKENPQGIVQGNTFAKSAAEFFNFCHSVEYSKSHLLCKMVLPESRYFIINGEEACPPVMLKHQMSVVLKKFDYEMENNNISIEYRKIGKYDLNQLIGIVLDKQNYDFKRIRMLSTWGFKDSTMFCEKMDALLNAKNHPVRLYQQQAGSENSTISVK